MIHMDDRQTSLIHNFEKIYGSGWALFSAPGRTELGGNHTDHQRGRVLAAAVDVDMLAAAAPRGGSVVRVSSDGYEPFQVDISNLEPVETEQGSTAAIIRGVCAEIAALGYKPEGFDMCVSSRVMPGSGLSSSAAFEVLTGAVVNEFFCGAELSSTELALIGQRAENRFFGKPCGLMDQMACACGGVIAIDFDGENGPIVRSMELDLAAQGYSLCLVDVRADHAGLTHEYAAITNELKSVCACFGKTFLRDVPEVDFYTDIARVRAATGDRAILRAMHVYEENRRVEAMTEALEKGDFKSFLQLVDSSGRSSWTCLQNVTPSGETLRQPAALALALCSTVLNGQGACRIHGGGFGGTVQAYVPMELLMPFKSCIEGVYGPGSCKVMKIRREGVCRLR